MRDNGPVTGREVAFPDGVVLVSRTDAAGKITFVNKNFVDISGYTSDELMGSPHNLVRHPDMPAAAFADLWKTVKDGNPWQGVVKNRCKSGDHYWVFATVTPEFENGRLRGYLSVRTKPSRQLVSGAEALYASVRTGTAPHLSLDGGRIVDNRPRARLTEKFQGIVWSFNTAFGVLGGMMLLLVAAFVLSMLNATTTADSVYQDGLVFSSQVAQVSDLSRDNAFQIAISASDIEEGKSIQKRIDTIKKNNDKAAKGYDRLSSWVKTSDQRESLSVLNEKRTAWVNDVVTPALAAAEKGDAAALRKIASNTLPNSLKALKSAQNDLEQTTIAVTGAKYEDQKHLSRIAMFIVPALAAIAIAVVLYFRRSLLTSIRRPLGRLSEIFEFISVNDIETQSRYLFEPVLEFRAASRSLRALRARLAFAAFEKAENDRQHAEQRKRELGSLAETLEMRVKSAVQTISSASVQLSDNADRLAHNVNNSETQSAAVRAETGEVAANIQAVSAATHELASSVTEISRQVAHAANIAGDAVTQAHSTNDIMVRMSEAAVRIGQVVDLISDIASQTNLLALNATIEAARAGDAGKGFAVVANEVKNLANQTARATEEIAKQIEGMQSETQTAVSAIDAISATITTINELSSAIATAVEEQGAATSEIARSVERASGSTASVVSSIEIVAQSAKDLGTMSHEVTSAAQSLRSEAGALDQEVNGFLSGLRSM